MIGLGYNLNMKKILLIAAIFVLLGVGFWLYKSKNVVTINKSSLDGTKISSAENEDNKVNIGPQNSLTGTQCESYNRRPFAVMYAGDAIARPLSGIASADLVVEAQVISGSITRMMALFTCGSPSQIGSIRSARHDFIPLAQGFDAIYVHWGGSHFALDILKQRVVDEIDALVNPFDVFYRDESIPAPHNGFTSMDRMMNAVEKLGYRTKSNFEGYSFYTDVETKNELAKGDSCASQKKFCSLTVPYAGSFRVLYDYDFERNIYSRYRGGKPEIDKLDGKQAEAKNIAIMIAPSHQIEGQYNDIAIEGKGSAIIYQNGREIKGFWQKDAANKQSRLKFFDESGQEIKFVPGRIWIEIVDPNEKATWK